ELLLPLTVGATVVVATAADARDSARLTALRRAHGANALQATPATWRLLLEADDGVDASLTALCGGEAMAPEIAYALAQRAGALWNLYGPTETTVWSSVMPITPRLAAGARRRGAAAPLGRPIRATRIHVVDARRIDPTLVPIGVQGELVIGGAGVAAGYRGRPAQTASVFVPDPFLDDPSEAGARLYRTGDLGRIAADGVLHFAGRLDAQVKLRGFRIELGEIEAALGAQPGVGAAVARLIGDGDDAQLVAWLEIAADGDADEATARVRDAAGRQLPSYMLPSRTIVASSLPRSASGKIDRRALVASLDGVDADGSRYAPPRTPLETALVEAFAAILDRPVADIGIHDDFFRRGGHSLRATRLVTRLQQTLAADALVEADALAQLTLRAVFEKPTPAGLAAHLGDRPPATADADAPVDRAPSSLDAAPVDATPALRFADVFDRSADDAPDDATRAPDDAAIAAAVTVPASLDAFEIAGPPDASPEPDLAPPPSSDAADVAAPVLQLPRAA
ncbi:MAG: non-ribosomal peptide synthetase, partial [Acidobacteriota bacterium]